MEGRVLRPQVRLERNACLRCALEYLEHTIAIVETQVDLGELDPRRLALLAASLCLETRLRFYPGG